MNKKAREMTDEAMEDAKIVRLLEEEWRDTEADRERGHKAALFAFGEYITAATIFRKKHGYPWSQK